jgi:hypothetical protein
MAYPRKTHKILDLDGNLRRVGYDHTDDVFGTRTVKGLLPVHPQRKTPYWLCVCECGITSEIRAESLRAGKGHTCRTCANRNTMKMRFGDNK